MPLQRLRKESCGMTEVFTEVMWATNGEIKPPFMKSYRVLILLGLRKGRQSPIKVISGTGAGQDFIGKLMFPKTWRQWLRLVNHLPACRMRRQSVKLNRIYSLCLNIEDLIVKIDLEVAKPLATCIFTIQAYDSKCAMIFSLGTKGMKLYVHCWRLKQEDYY